MKEKLKKIAKNRIFTLIGILIFIGICLGIGSMIAFIQHESDPTDVAATYFRAFVGNDYNKMYECLYKEEGYYLDKNLYMDTMKKLRSQYVIDTYEIKEPENKNGQKTVTVVCRNENSGKTKNFDVLIASKRKGFSITPEYYVDISNLTVKRFSVTIPKGNQLQLNDVTITDKMADIKNDGNNVMYNITGMLSGKYKICGTNDAYSMVSSINLTESNNSIDLTKEKHIANAKYSKLINDSGRKILDEFYKAVRKRKPDNDKLIKLFSDKKAAKSAKKLVEESEKIVYWKDTKNIDKYKVIDMSMKNLKSGITYDDKKKTYTLTYDYSYDYVSATDTALYNSYVYKLSGKCTSKMTIKYEAQKDKVIVRDIQIKNKNKKND